MAPPSRGGEGREGIGPVGTRLERVVAELLFQEIEPDPQPDVPLGIGVEDRMDGARSAAVAAGQHLHQRPARPVIPRHEVRQADDPLPRQRQLTQGFPAAGPQGRGDGESVPLLLAQ